MNENKENKQIECRITEGLNSDNKRYTIVADATMRKINLIKDVENRNYTTIREVNIDFKNRVINQYQHDYIISQLKKNNQQ